MGQPSISYKVIRRFISSKEFESAFGLQLLANTLNDMIQRNGLGRLPGAVVKQRMAEAEAEGAEVPLRGRRTSEDDSDGSGSTVPFDTSTCSNLPKKDVNTDKETFFSSDTDDESSASRSEESSRRIRRIRRRRGIKRKKSERSGEMEKSNGVSNSEDEELEKLLRLTDINPSVRSNKSESKKEDECNEGEKKNSKNNKNNKEKEVELSLMDCLDGAECENQEKDPEREEEETENDFLSLINNQMKNAFLQSSDGSEDSTPEDDEEEEEEEQQEKSEEEQEEEKRKDENPPKKEEEKKVEKEKDKNKRKDDLREFRFTETTTETDKESGVGAATDKESAPGGTTEYSSDSSVECVEHVQKKKDDSKSEQTTDSDSSSDIQQVYCKTNSSPIKGRKNINKILKKDSLQVETKQALKMENERKKRVAERMKLFEVLFKNKNNKLILDFDPDTKEELLVVDSYLSGHLKPHQKDGVRFMWNCCFESLKRLEEDSGSGCVLAHCMGLGKTLQVISLVHTVLTQNTGVHTVMIMCPLNTLRNWAHEFEMWQRGCVKKVKPVDIIPCKTKHSRIVKIRAWGHEGGVLLISYEMFRSLVKKDFQGGAIGKGLLDPGPDLVVCDEGHVLKNNNSALSKCMSRIKTLRRIILTGTPLQNNLIEYYCMVQFVKPNILGTKKEFLNRFVNPINNGQFEDSTQLDVRLMKRRAHVLHTMLDGFIQRFGYYVLTPFLPEKQEYVISISLMETQENIYKQFVNQCTREGRGLLRDFHILQRVWTHPRVMLMHWKKNKQEDNARELWEKFVREGEYDNINSSGKLVVLFNILKRCREIGDKVLVFSQSLYSLDLIEYFLQKANNYHMSGLRTSFADRWVLGQDYFRLDGSTSSDNRDAYCQGFNSVSNERARLFLISTKAGGLGINLVAANRVVVFDASWNPTHDVQSIFRVYRFGQSKVCYIYRFLAAATMEEKIYKRQVTKLSLAHRILDEHQIERHYTMGNLQELYRYDPISKSEKKVPKVPKDNIFAEILAKNRDIIVSYHEHDSLLENKEEEELTEEERQAAWEDYEKEKQIPEQPRVVLNGSGMNWLNNDGLRVGHMYRQGLCSTPQSAFINQSESDLCKIVEVRTLNTGSSSSVGGIDLNKLLEFGETFGVKRNEGEDFEKYCWRVHSVFKRVFPWGNSGRLVRGTVNGVNEV